MTSILTLSYRCMYEKHSQRDGDMTGLELRAVTAIGT